jgi:hypothetical protein
MLSWFVILYRAVLSVIASLLLVTLLSRERRPAVRLTVVPAALAGPSTCTAARPPTVPDSSPAHLSRTFRSAANT